MEHHARSLILEYIIRLPKLIGFKGCRLDFRGLITRKSWRSWFVSNPRNFSQTFFLFPPTFSLGPASGFQNLFLTSAKIRYFLSLMDSIFNLQ